MLSHISLPYLKNGKENPEKHRRVHEKSANQPLLRSIVQQQDLVGTSLKLKPCPAEESVSSFGLTTEHLTTFGNPQRSATPKNGLISG